MNDRRVANWGVSKGSALRLRLTDSVVQPTSCYDLLIYKAIGSNYLSLVVTSMLVSTSPLDEARTATYFPLSQSSGTVGRGLLTSSRAPTIQSRRGHQCGVSKGSALRLRLTGSVVQPMSCYDLLIYKAIGSNHLSFVVTSMLVSTSPLDEAGTATKCFDAQKYFLSTVKSAITIQKYLIMEPPEK